MLSSVEAGAMCLYNPFIVPILTDEVLNIGELETLIASKDKTIKELTEAEVILKLENKTWRRMRSVAQRPRSILQDFLVAC